MDRLAFKFYRSYFEIGKELDDKNRLAFYDALLNKQFNGIDPDLKSMAKFAYISQKHSIDAQVKGWIDKIKKVRNIDVEITPIVPPYEPPTQGGTQPPIKPPSIQLKEKEKEKEKLSIESILEQKKKDFLAAMQHYKNEFDSELLNDFYFYWTETKPNSKLLRWEREKAFDMVRRLNSWERNSTKFNPKQKIEKL